MSFIEDHIIPRLPLEDVGVTTSKCIRCDTDVEVMLVIPPLSQFLASFCRPVVAKRFESWQKFLEFHLPVQEYTRRNNLLKCLRFQLVRDESWLLTIKCGPQIPRSHAR